MNISAIKPGLDSLPQASLASSPDVAQRRQVIQAARMVNESGVLGQNQLVFLVDRQTHRPIIRVEDRETHEVLLQLPPEYVLRLAEEMRNASK